MAQITEEPGTSPPTTPELPPRGYVIMAPAGTELVPGQLTETDQFLNRLHRWVEDPDEAFVYQQRTSFPKDRAARSRLAAAVRKGRFGPAVSRARWEELEEIGARPFPRPPRKSATPDEVAQFEAEVQRLSAEAQAAREEQEAISLTRHRSAALVMSCADAEVPALTGGILVVGVPESYVEALARRPWAQSAVARPEGGAA